MEIETANGREKVTEEIGIKIEELIKFTGKNKEKLDFVM